MQVDNAAEYAGTFIAPDGKAVRFAADGKRLALVMGDRTIPLQRAGDDSFVSTVPGAMAAYAISFGRAGEEKNPGPVVDVSYGPEWFAGEKYTGAKSFHVPDAYALFAGHYRSDSPWGGDGRVYILKDKLVVEGTPLSPLGHAIFRVGEAWSPITAEFLVPFEGRPRLLRMGGMDYWRIEAD
jgi:D-alanyl-D-alanine carboxypeptidase